MDNLTSVLLLGIGATAITDLWGFARGPLLGVPAPDYGMVGRWFGHMAYGRFRHHAIAQAPSIPGELVIGWLAHYVIGIVYAAVLVAIAGVDWLGKPSLALALCVGIGSVAAPLLLMQPAMGAGLAARRTARPNHARIHSLLMHTVFGVGLYLTGLGLRVLRTG
jgi:hypothetical protein